MEELVYSALKVLILIALTEITKRLGLVEKYVPTAAQPLAMAAAIGEPATGALAAATVATIDGIYARYVKPNYANDPTPEEMKFITAWTGKPASEYSHTEFGHNKQPPGHRAYHIGRNGIPITVVFKE